MRLTKIITTTAFAALLSVGTVVAQDAPPGGERRGGGNFPQLTEKQRDLLREAAQKNADQIRPLEEKMRAAQKELVKAALAEKYDEAAVKQKSEALAKAQAEVTALRAKQFSVLAPTLTPEQREQFENSPFGAAMLMGGGRFGGGGGLGGGQPGDGPRRERRPQ